MKNKNYLFINYTIFTLLSVNLSASTQLNSLQDIPTIEQVKTIRNQYGNNEVEYQKYIENLSTDIYLLQLKRVHDKTPKKFSKNHEGNSYADELMRADETKQTELSNEFGTIFNSYLEKLKTKTKDLENFLTEESKQYGRKQMKLHPEQYKEFPLLATENSFSFKRIILPFLKIFYSLIGYEPVKLLK